MSQRDRPKQASYVQRHLAAHPAIILRDDIERKMKPSQAKEYKVSRDDMDSIGIVPNKIGRDDPKLRVRSEPLRKEKKSKVLDDINSAKIVKYISIDDIPDIMPLSPSSQTKQPIGIVCKADYACVLQTKTLSPEKRVERPIYNNGLVYSQSSRPKSVHLAKILEPFPQRVNDEYFKRSDGDEDDWNDDVSDHHNDDFSRNQDQYDYGDDYDDFKNEEPKPTSAPQRVKYTPPSQPKVAPSNIGGSVNRGKGYPRVESSHNVPATDAATSKVAHEHNVTASTKAKITSTQSISSGAVSSAPVVCSSGTSSRMRLGPPSFPCESHSSESEDASLFYSKQPRQVDFKPYTLGQYRMIKPKDYQEIAALKPDLNREDLIAKRSNADRIKEFSKNLQKFNRDVLVQQRKLPDGNEMAAIEVSKKKCDSKREKAIAFAKNVPKPKIRIVKTDFQQGPGRRPADEMDPFDDYGLGMEPTAESSKIEELNAKHLESKRQVEAIKRSMGLA